jgi:betaine-aldehyde dehydrogenase
VVDGSPDDAKRACLKAAEAGRKWRHLPAIERGKLLHDAATKMREDRARLSELLTLEGGKPRIENLDEVEWSAACFQYYAEIARNSHGMSIPPTGEHQINFTIKEPLGVVAAIVPFNYPLLLLVWKIAPALAAGNTVVIKPSELTPLATLRLVEQSMSHLPPGVINVVTGTGQEVGEALVDDPNVACIAFTGSTAVGTRIAVKAAAQLKRVNLELGGIDPLIVFEDADLDIAVPGAAWARYLNAGQVCTSAKRIYVVEKIAKPFIERFVAQAQTIRVGNPMDPETDMGPLISEKARARVEDQVKRAVAQGAKVMAGGKRLDVGPGYFYAPTVLSEVKVDHPVVCEEVFGPIASIEVVKDADQAISRAAQSEYEPHLGHARDERDQGRHLLDQRSAHRQRCGAVWRDAQERDGEGARGGGARCVPRDETRAPRLRPREEVFVVPLSYACQGDPGMNQSGRQRVCAP